jgi:hypothetical protein
MATLKVIIQSLNYSCDYYINYPQRERWVDVYNEIHAKENRTEVESYAHDILPKLQVRETECFELLYQAAVRENAARANSNIGAQQLTMGYDKQKPGANGYLTGQQMGLSMRLKVEKQNRVKAFRNYLQVLNEIQEVIEKLGLTWVR